MGCEVNVQLEADEGAVDMLRHIPTQVAAIEAALTRFRPDSELMRFNKRAGQWVPVSDILFRNIHSARQAARLTDGLYNPLILPALVASGYERSFEQIGIAAPQPAHPAADWREIELNMQARECRIPTASAIDLGGIAKGWTAAWIAEHLAQTGPCLVNFGGDMVAHGKPDNQPGWPVEIEDPLTGAVFACIHLRNASIATSGTDFRRWQDRDGGTHHHIIDPRSGSAAQSDVLAVSVIHPNATQAEASAKAVLLRGAEDGLNWLNHQWHSTGIVFRHDGGILATSNFAELIEERNVQS